MLSFPTLIYLKKYGLKNNLIILALFSISVAVQSMSFKFLFKLGSNEPYLGLNESQKVTVWIILLLLNVLTQILYRCGIMRGSLNASKKSHKNILQCFSQWTIKSIESFDSGQIMNIFSKDLSTCDTELYRDLSDLISRVEFMVSFILLQAFLNWYQFGAVFFMIVVFVVFQVFEILFICLQELIIDKNLNLIGQNTFRKS